MDAPARSHPSLVALALALSFAACGAPLTTPDARRDDASTPPASDAPLTTPDALPRPPDAPATTDDDAEIVAADLPATLACGAAVRASVTVRNTGRATWTRAAGYRLGGVDDSDPFFAGDTRVELPDGARVAPGETHRFEFELRAPAALAAGTHVTDWRMVHESVRWFGAVARREVSVTCATTGPRRRTGAVALAGNSLRDDGGTFNALGATMMWAAWAYKFDRPRLERNLELLARNGFDYIRALGVVGHPGAPDYWDGREIDWRWPDYAAVIAGLTDLAYDRYGLRVEWTLIGDGQLNIPNEADRYRLVDTFLAMSRGREQKIIHFEIANEAWQNGFEGDTGVTQLRALTRYMNERTAILVAASAPAGFSCPDYQRVYTGGVADLATIHFDRDIRQADGAWRPVRMPWELEDCPDIPVGSNNEPIGPGASVNTENEPVRLVAAAVATYVSNLPLYVFHSGAGVRGDTDFAGVPGISSFVHLHRVVPGDLASWTRRNAHWPDAPFQPFAGDASGNLVADRMWPDVPGATSGAVRVYGDVRGNEFFVFPFGIRGRLVLAARRAMEFDVIDPMTGATRSHHVLAAGGRVELAGAEALILRGQFR